ncbi:MAG: DinB family protein [Candidatus Thorarchaeota archaeon]|jgi:hypothetical protein
MTERILIQDAINRLSDWWKAELNQIASSGLTDLSYRPRNGMSSLGWVLAHQVSVFDYTLNGLIRGTNLRYPDLFMDYRPGTKGDWDGIPLGKIKDYYKSCEGAFLEWVELVNEDELSRVIEDKTVPKYFVGKTIRQVIMDMICHISIHTGHLAAIRRDWTSIQKLQHIYKI